MVGMGLWMTISFLDGQEIVPHSLKIEDTQSPVVPTPPSPLKSEEQPFKYEDHEELVHDLYTDLSKMIEGNSTSNEPDLDEADYSQIETYYSAHEDGHADIETITDESKPKIETTSAVETPRQTKTPMQLQRGQRVYLSHHSILSESLAEDH